MGTGAGSTNLKTAVRNADYALKPRRAALVGAGGKLISDSQLEKGGTQCGLRTDTWREAERTDMGRGAGPEGPRSSALVGGYTTLHRDLERDIAQLKGAEAALLFPTGFAANLAAVTAVASSRDAVIFSDELNHASIVDGCRLAARCVLSIPCKNTALC
jgi:hypothetical protein